MQATAPVFARPDAGEHHDYYGRYIGLVPDGDIVETLERQGQEMETLLRGVPAALETHRYAEGKWSIREVVGHVTDTERLFAFRALHIARGDPAPLPGMEQEDWARISNAHERPLSNLTDEFLAVRRATVLLFRGMAAEAPLRRGVASGWEVTVRALAWIIAGHERHHARILRERYLSGGGGA